MDRQRGTSASSSTSGSTSSSFATAPTTSAAHPRPLRALLPAFSPPFTAREPSPQQQRHRARVACMACRARKSKCDTAQPQCNECAIRVIPCVYPDSSAALNRRHTDLAAVFERLRTAPEAEARDLLQKIRDGADAGAILQPHAGRGHPG